MKRKINIQLIGIAMVAIFATMFLMTGIFYEIFKQQVQEDLRLDAEVLKNTSVFTQDNVSHLDVGVSELRVTWIEEDGTVLYDNDADVGNMENHGDRPEVLEALENGYGETVRTSETMNTNTFYYALRLEDGSILRVAREAGSIWSVFYRSFPIIGGIILVMIALSVLAAHFLTRKLIEPVEQLVNHMDDYNGKTTYRELVPLVRTIRVQHENILEAAKVRQDFTANVSHELKTPLTAISGYAELIENRMVQGEQTVGFAKEIRHNSDRLLSLINDIINLSELDRTEDQITLETVDLYEIAQSCGSNLEMAASRRDIDFSCVGEHCEIRANRELVAELIQNLGENAIRYNNPGGMVEIRVSQEPEGVALTVKDNGIGIPKEHQERIFERFYRVDKSRSKQTGGTGLGLAIVKHIVAIHGAALTLESREGVGTTIRILF